MTTSEEYGKTPITLRPEEVVTSRRYEGKLNMFTDNEHPLTIEVPSPPIGVYRYTVIILREREEEKSRSFLLDDDR